MRRAERAARRTEPLRVAEQPEWRRLSQAIRRQIAAVVELDADRAALTRLAERAEALAAELEQRAPGKRIALVDSAWENEQGTMAYLPFSPIMGALNPASIGIEIRQQDDRVVSEIRLDEVAEGAGGLVHGGVISGIYDELLAAANLMIKSGGPTGTLTIRYRRPTPLYTWLRFEAWVDRTDERKVYAKGHCRVGAEIVTEAEAVFVKFTPDWKKAGWQPPEPGRPPNER
ncbi:MAG: PaaI family thioesterase [Myxococcota bacterium]